MIQTLAEPLKRACLSFAVSISLSLLGIPSNLPKSTRLACSFTFPQCSNCPLVCQACLDFDLSHTR